MSEIRWSGGQRQIWLPDPDPVGELLCGEYDDPTDSAEGLCGTPLADGPCREHHPDPLEEELLQAWWDSPVWFTFGDSELGKTLGGPDQARRHAARNAIEVFRRLYPAPARPQLMKTPHDLAGLVAQPQLTHLVYDAAPMSGAVFSPCGDYRYLLAREFGTSGTTAVYIMLNPSTANALDNDPTINRCAYFAQREGCGALVVVNVFALRSTDPSKLAGHPDPFGDCNNPIISAVLDAASVDGGPVIVAWGADAFMTRSGEAQHIAAMLATSGIRPRCFGTTKAGHPKHPLYLHGRTPMIPYTFPGEAR